MQVDSTRLLKDAAPVACHASSETSHWEWRCCCNQWARGLLWEHGQIASQELRARAVAVEVVSGEGLGSCRSYLFLKWLERSRTFLDIQIKMFGPQARFRGRTLNLLLYFNRNDYCCSVVCEARQRDSTQLLNPVSSVLPEAPAAMTPGAYLLPLMTS